MSPIDSDAGDSRARRTAAIIAGDLRDITFASLHAGIKAEIARCLSKARLMISSRLAAPAGSFVVGDIKAQHVVIVQAAQGATVNIAQSSTGEAASDVIATLLQEIEGVQDLVIGNRKQLLVFAEEQDVIKADLRAIVRRVEARLGSGPVDQEILRSAVEQVVTQMRLASELQDGPLRRFVNHGIVQSTLGSTVYEVLKHILAS